MSKATLYNYSITGTSVIDELYQDVGSSTLQLGTVKRAFAGGSELSIRPGDAASHYLVEGVDYELVDEDFNYTEECGFAVYTGVRILNSDYQTGDLYISYTCIGSYTDITQIRLTRVGELLTTMEKITLSATDPWFDLTSSSQEIAAASLPDYVTYKRGLLAELPYATTYETTCTCSGTTLTLAASKTFAAGTELFFNGQFRTVVSGSGTSYVLDEPMKVSSAASLWSVSRASTTSLFPLTHYSITSNVVSLYMNNGDTTSRVENYLMMKQLADDYYFDKSYRTVTLPEAIGAIGAGTYQLLSVAAANVGTSSAVMTFAYTADNVGSTAISTNVQFHPFRIAGSTTTAKHYQILDMAIMTGGMYGVTGYRSRDVMQGHYHDIYTSDFLAAAAANTLKILNSATNKSAVANIQIPITDGTNPTPNTGPITRPRSGNYHIYEYVGEVA